MVPQVALIAWIVTSIVLFAMLSPLRAFLLTYVIGILFLPVEFQDQGVIIISQSLRIEKFDACNIGALLGTLLFAPHIFKRYRFHWMDVALFIVLGGQFLTSIVNELGAKDGFSVAMEYTRDFLPIIFLARLYLTSVGEVYQAMRAIIGGAVVYSFICVWEWRLSPQLHTNVYGYFQHDFIQYMRDGHFRPAGFLRHAIEVSGFMGASTAMALWLWYKKLFKPLWGLVPISAVAVALSVGLLSTMTVAGISEMLLAAGLLALVALTRSRWFLIILPVVSLLWMAGRYTDFINEDFLLQTASAYVSPERLQSLDYRLKSERLNLTGLDNHLLLGKGSQHAFVANEEGKSEALDAWWLIQIIFFGLLGIAGWYLIWCACIFETMMRWRGLTPDLQTLSAAICILVGVQFVDFLFNSFPSMFLLILNVGIVSAMQRYKPVRAARRVVAAEEQNPGPMSPEVVMR